MKWGCSSCASSPCCLWLREARNVMVQLSLRERLQPALFDRLIDDERLLTCYEFAFRRAELETLRISAAELMAILTAQGLRAVDARYAAAAAPTSAAASNEETLTFTLIAPGGRVSLSQLKSLVLKPPGKPQGLLLHSFCEITSRSVINP